MEYIYKILWQEEWEAIEANNLTQFQGTPLDIQDGFLHFSTDKQLENTISRFFNEKNRKIILLKIKLDSLKEKIVWDYVESIKEHFPHLYEPLPLSEVEEVIERTL